MSTKIVRRRAHIKKRQSDFSNRRNIFNFLTEQAFFIAIAAMDTIAPLTFLAFARHLLLSDQNLTDCELLKSESIYVQQQIQVQVN